MIAHPDFCALADIKGLLIQRIAGFTDSNEDLNATIHLRAPMLQQNP